MRIAKQKVIPILIAAVILISAVILFVNFSEDEEISRAAACNSAVAEAKVLINNSIKNITDWWETEYGFNEGESIVNVSYRAESCDLDSYEEYIEAQLNEDIITSEGRIAYVRVMVPAYGCYIEGCKVYNISEIKSYEINF